MVRLKVHWAERALEQLREIGAYIALEDLEAARTVVTKVQEAVDRLERFPESGRTVPEFSRLPQREVVVPPCRIFYRVEGHSIWIVYVTRSERIIRRSDLTN